MILDPNLDLDCQILVWIDSGKSIRDVAKYLGWHPRKVMAILDRYGVVRTKGRPVGSKTKHTKNDEIMELLGFFLYEYEQLQHSLNHKIPKRCYDNYCKALVELENARTT